MRTGIKIVGLLTLFVIVLSIILFVYPYAKSYRPIETYDRREKLPLKGEPKIYSSTGDWIDDYKRMVANNFILLGTSDYNASQIGSTTALTLAELIGAEIVIIENKFADTQTKVIPFPVHGWKSVNNSDSETGKSDPSGSALIPNAISEVDYGAQFWARAKLPVFGANFSNFNATDTRNAGTDEGVKVYVLIDNSPAADGKVSINDLITHVNGNPIRDVSNFMEIIEDNAGSEIILSVVRKKQKLTLAVKLNGLK